MRESRKKLSIDALTDLLRDRVSLCIICFSDSWGGVEQIVVNDAIDLSELGLKVNVLCLDGSPIHENLRNKDRVELSLIDFKPSTFIDLKLKRVIDEQVKKGINVFYTHQTSLMGTLVPSFFNRPSCVLLACKHFMSRRNNKTPFTALLYKRLDSLVVINQILRKNVLETLPVNHRKVKVIHLGLDFNRFDPDQVDPTVQRAKWDADEDTVVIGMVGRIDPAKGQEAFIKAAAGLTKRPRKGEKLKFVIVGEQTLGTTGDYLEELKKMVSQFQLDGHVIFDGYQDNIPEVMRAFDIFVMPSKQEALGLVAVEAMAMECPIIISRGISARDVVGEGEFGLLMRPGDAFDLQQSLRYLIDNPMKRVQIGQKARSHVVGYYDRRVRVHKTLDLFSRVLKQRELG